MKIKYKTIFIFLIIFSTFHLVRDIFQILHIENITTTVFEMEKNWCGNYCNWLTIPMEIFIFFGSLIMIKRKKEGNLAYLIAIILAIWTMMFIYDYFIFN
ncbi:MAG: hypothetical protein ABFQ62_03220 [Patescibacteria group bacterium]